MFLVPFFSLDSSRKRSETISAHALNLLTHSRNAITITFNIKYSQLNKRSFRVSARRDGAFDGSDVFTFTRFYDASYDNRAAISKSELRHKGAARTKTLRQIPLYSNRALRLHVSRVARNGTLSFSFPDRSMRATTDANELISKNNNTHCLFIV